MYLKQQYFGGPRVGISLRTAIIFMYSFLKDAGPKDYQKAEDGLWRVWVGRSSCTSHLVTAVVH